MSIQSLVMCMGSSQWTLSSQPNQQQYAQSLGTLEGAVQGDARKFPQTCSGCLAELPLKQRLSRAATPEDMKGGPMQRSLNCLSTLAARGAQQMLTCITMLYLKTSMVQATLRQQRRPLHGAKHHGPPAVKPWNSAEPPEHSSAQHDAPAELTEVAEHLVQRL